MRPRWRHRSCTWPWSSHAPPIDWSLLDEPVVIAAVASIRKVARQDVKVADNDRGLALVNLSEAGGEVPLGPALGSMTVAVPAPVMVAGEQQLAPLQRSDECECLTDASERDVTEHPDDVVGVDDRPMPAAMTVVPLGRFVSQGCLTSSGASPTTTEEVAMVVH